MSDINKIILEVCDGLSPEQIQEVLDNVYELRSSYQEEYFIKVLKEQVSLIKSLK